MPLTAAMQERAAALGYGTAPQQQQPQQTQGGVEKTLEQQKIENALKGQKNVSKSPLDGVSALTGDIPQETVTPTATIEDTEQTDSSTPTATTGTQSSIVTGNQLIDQWREQYSQKEQAKRDYNLGIKTQEGGAFYGEDAEKYINGYEQHLKEAMGMAEPSGEDSTGRHYYDYYSPQLYNGVYVYTGTDADTKAYTDWLNGLRTKDSDGSTQQWYLDSLNDTKKSTDPYGWMEEQQTAMTAQEEAVKIAQSKYDTAKRTSGRDFYQGGTNVSSEEAEEYSKDLALQQAKYDQLKREYDTAVSVYGTPEEYREQEAYSKWYAQQLASGKTWEQIYAEAQTAVDNAQKKKDEATNTLKGIRSGEEKTAYETMWADVLGMGRTASGNAAAGQNEADAETALEAAQQEYVAAQKVLAYANANKYRDLTDSKDYAKYIEEGKAQTQQLYGNMGTVPYSEEELAAAEAKVAQAEENFKQLRLSGAISTELDAAREAINEAEEELDLIKGGTFYNSNGGRAALFTSKTGNKYQQSNMTNLAPTPSSDWSEDQLNLYYAILSQKGKDAADDYARGVINENNAKEKAKETSGIANWARNADTLGGKIGSTALALGGQVVSMPGKLGDWMNKATQVLTTGSYVDTKGAGLGDYTDAAMSNVAARQNEQYGTLNEDIPIIGGKGVGDLTQLAGSVVQSMAYGNMLGSGGTLALFFGSAADSAFDDAMSRGASGEQAVIYSFLSGATEAVTEKLSLDNLLDGKITGSLILEILKQGGIEASEEGMSSLLNLFADKWVMQDKSKINQRINELMSTQGMTYEEAGRQAVKETASDVAWDTIGGFISGAASGAVQKPIQAAAQTEADFQSGLNQASAGFGTIDENERIAKEKAEQQKQQLKQLQLELKQRQHEVELALIEAAQAGEASRRENQRLEAENAAREIGQTRLRNEAQQRERLESGEASKGFGTAENFIDNRTNKSVAKTGTKSFQFDHPELHNYYADAAKRLKEECQNAKNKRSIPAVLSELSGNMSVPEIVKCLDAIIEDNGVENYAAAKRVELVLNNMLQNGWTTTSGETVPPNKSYTDTLSNIKQRQYSSLLADTVTDTQKWNAVPANPANQVIGKTVTTPREGSTRVSSEHRASNSPMTSKNAITVYPDLEYNIAELIDEKKSIEQWYSREVAKNGESEELTREYNAKLDDLRGRTEVLLKDEARTRGSTVYQMDGVDYLLSNITNAKTETPSQSQNNAPTSEVDLEGTSNSPQVENTDTANPDELNKQPTPAETEKTKSAEEILAESASEKPTQKTVEERKEELERQIAKQSADCAKQLRDEVKKVTRRRSLERIVGIELANTYTKQEILEAFDSIIDGNGYADVDPRYFIRIFKRLGGETLDSRGNPIDRLESYTAAEKELQSIYIEEKRLRMIAEEDGTSAEQPQQTEQPAPKTGADALFEAATGQETETPQTQAETPQETAQESVPSNGTRSMPSTAKVTPEQNSSSTGTANETQEKTVKVAPQQSSTQTVKTADEVLAENAIGETETSTTQQNTVTESKAEKASLQMSLEERAERAFEMWQESQNDKENAKSNADIYAETGLIVDSKTGNVIKPSENGKPPQLVRVNTGTGQRVENQRHTLERNSTKARAQDVKQGLQQKDHERQSDEFTEQEARRRIDAYGSENEIERLLGKLENGEAFGNEDMSEIEALISDEYDKIDEAQILDVDHTNEERLEIYAKAIENVQKLENLREQVKGEAARVLRQTGFLTPAKKIKARVLKTFWNNVDEKGKPQWTNAQKVKQIFKTLKEIDSVKNGDTENMIGIIKGISQIRGTNKVFGGKLTKSIDSMLDYMSKTEGGFDYLKMLAYGNCDALISDEIGSDLPQKIKATQIGHMLSNPSTWLNNFGNNFAALFSNAISQNTAGRWADIALSKLTGTRTLGADKSAGHDKRVSEASKKAVVMATLNVLFDVNTDGSKYESTGTNTFKMNSSSPLERIAAQFQMITREALVMPDEMAKARVETGLDIGREELVKSGKMTERVKAELSGDSTSQANFRSLQQDTSLTKAVNNFREKLNSIPLMKGKKNGKLGLGDMAMVFSKVPTNVVSQKLQSSPIGWGVTMIQYFDAMNKARKGELSAKDQARISRQVGRTLNGVSLTLLSTVGAMCGFVKRFDDDDDDDKYAVNKAKGLTGLQWNLSAMFRGITGQGVGDWQDDDIIVGGDWLEILSLPATLGVEMYQEYLDNDLSLNNVAKFTAENIFDTLLSLPGMSTLEDIWNNIKYDNDPFEVMTSAVANTISSIVVPNAVTQLAAGIDNTERDVYTTDYFYEAALNNFAKKIPFLRSILPEKKDVFGEKMTYGENVLMSIVNKTILPGDVRRNEASDYEDVVDILASYGDGSLYPTSNSTKSITPIKGDESSKFTLTADEQRKHRDIYGQTSTELVTSLENNELYKYLDSNTQHAIVKDLLSVAVDNADRAIAEERGVKYTSKYDDEHNLTSLTDYFIGRELLGEYSSDGKKRDFGGVDDFIAACNDGTVPEDVVNHLIKSTTYHVDELMEAANNGVGSKEFYTYLTDKQTIDAAKDRASTSIDYKAIDDVFARYDDMSDYIKETFTDTDHFNSLQTAYSHGSNAEQWYKGYDIMKDVEAKATAKNASVSDNEKFKVLCRSKGFSTNDIDAFAEDVLGKAQYRTYEKIKKVDGIDEKKAIDLYVKIDSDGKYHETASSINGMDNLTDAQKLALLEAYLPGDSETGKRATTVRGFDNAMSGKQTFTAKSGRKTITWTKGQFTFDQWSNVLNTVNDYDVKHGNNNGTISEDEFEGAFTPRVISSLGLNGLSWYDIYKTYRSVYDDTQTQVMGVAISNERDIVAKEKKKDEYHDDDYFNDIS